jgi:hypothetical protein
MKERIEPPSTLEPTYRDPREHDAAEELSLIDLRTIQWLAGPPSGPFKGIRGPFGSRLAHPVGQSRGSEGFSVADWPIQWAIQGDPRAFR